ncbi:uncharacterized protein [Eurosta solidaginis]|uniref:uncharacterized protein n=1 Tax=Eurosta solidaginis TaxID=178769 RepID=UPI003530A953
MNLSTIFFIALTIIFAVATVKAQKVINEAVIKIDDEPSEASNTEVLQINTETSDKLWEEYYKLLIDLGSKVEQIFGLPTKLQIDYGIYSEKDDKLNSTTDKKDDKLNSTTADENNIQPPQEMPDQETSIESSENKTQPAQEIAVESTGNKNPLVQEMPVDGTNTKFLDSLRKGDNEEKPQQEN